MLHSPFLEVCYFKIQENKKATQVLPHERSLKGDIGSFNSLCLQFLEFFGLYFNLAAGRASKTACPCRR